MDQKHIIKFEHGTLYLKLQEELNTHTMHIHMAMARIDRDGLEIVKGDSGLDVTSVRMRLDRHELALISQGYEMVKHFWTEQELPRRHVLLTCGCIRDWDSLIEGHWAHGMDFVLWCPDHDETKVYRCNKTDFPEIEAQAKAQEVQA